MAEMSNEQFAQMMKDIRELERKYDMVLVPILEEDAIGVLRDAIVQDESEEETFGNVATNLVHSAWSHGDLFKSDIRDAYSTDEPLRKVLFNKFRWNLVNWAIDPDAMELPRRIYN